MKETHHQALISPLAVVDPTAQLGEGVRVDPFAIIEGNTIIGRGTHIHSGAVICSGARLGEECQVHPYAVIGGIPQDLKFQGEETTAEVGDRTVIREYVTINRGTASKGKTVVGKDCLIMAYAHVAHDCFLSDNIIIGNAVQLAGEVVIDYHAIISGGALVHQFVHIGEHTMIQGGSKVTKDIPPYTLIGREPIMYCGINIVGLRRRNFTNQQIFLINDIYRTLYNRGLNNSEAIRVIDSEYEEQPEKHTILEFLKNSQRGVVKGGTSD